MRKLIALVIGVIFLAGCTAPQTVVTVTASAPASVQPTKDDNFAAYVHDVLDENGVDRTAQQEADFVDTAKTTVMSVCSALDNGATKDDVVKMIYDASGGNQKVGVMLAKIIGYGVGTYCPQNS